MNNIGEEIAKIILAIIGVAIIAVIVAKKADTANVITSAGTAFSNVLKTIMAPVS